GGAGDEVRAERILAAHRDTESAVGEDGEGERDAEDPDQPELLADHGPDHVGGRLRQEADLLGSVAYSDTSDAAGAERVQGLDALVAGAGRVLPGVEE